MTGEDAWAAIRLEVSRLAHWIGDLADSLDRAHRLIAELTDRLDRLDPPH